MSQSVNHASIGYLLAMAFVAAVAARVAALPATTTPATQPVPASAPMPASVPATVLQEPTTNKVDLAIPGRAQPALYWLRRPRGHGPGQYPPLLIALHGTDDLAREMVDFWAARQARVPTIIAAPQGIGKGWRDEDVPAIRAMLADLQARVPFDERRVLLAGFSAGGAMSFHLLYAERIPATAVAALANYVPPGISDADVRARASVPVFYAVGMDDVNHERMRQGIDGLRQAGGNVDLYRPRIGHLLDAGVAQAALDWFFDQCARQIEATIKGVAPESNVGRSAQELERIIQQAAWHESTHLRKATEALDRVESPGRRDLRTVQGLIEGGRPADAVDLLRQIETTYGASRLGSQARQLRIRTEMDPRVSEELARRAGQRRADDALAMYAAAQRLVAQGKWSDAAARCRRVIELYGETPSAERARRLLDLLEQGSSP